MKISFTKKEFDTLKTTAEDAYKLIGAVRCPYLQTDIAFNAKGLDHLKLKRWNHGRAEKDQFMRLKLLHLAPEILKQSRTLQGIKSSRHLERMKIHSRWEEKLVPVTYYEFISVQPTPHGDQSRVRIVVKQIDGGQPYFWSIIPYWRQRDQGKELFEGDPEED